MSTNVSDEITGACSCGWFPPRAEAVRKAQSHAALTGHTVTFQIVRTITVRGRE